MFGAEGARAAVAARMDMLGVVVLALATALGGGMLRDVLLGATPPAALRDRRYLLAAIAGAAAALTARNLFQPGTAFLVTDAAGLSLFAVAGTQKAVALGQKSLTCVLLGTLTATGGGMAADLLANRVPAILHVDFYASAALAGAAALVGLRRAGMDEKPAALCAGMLCFALRLCGAFLHWHLPVPAPG